jgi:hypothetical protein
MNKSEKYIIVFLIILGTLDFFYGTGLFGIIIYGILLIYLSGFTSGLNIFTGLGLVSRHKRDNLPQSKGKPPFAFTIDGNGKGAMDGKEKRYNEIRAKKNW